MAETLRPPHAAVSRISSMCRKAKDVVVTVFLSLVYVLLFGVFRVIVVVFDRKLLRSARNRESYWLTAEGYNQDIQECTRQS